MTLMAVYILMAHALIQEGIIQGQSGIHPVKAILVRIGAAVVTLLVMAPFVGSSPVMPAAAGGVLSAPPAFPEVMRHWAWTTARLTAKILRHHHAPALAPGTPQILRADSPFVRALRPLLRIMGLDEKVGFLWMTAVIFGLSYGGAIIVEEAKSAT